MSELARRLIGEADQRKPGLSHRMRQAALASARELIGRDLDSLLKSASSERYNPYRVHAVTVGALGDGTNKVYLTYGDGSHRWFGPLTDNEVEAIQQAGAFDYVSNHNWHFFDDHQLDDQFKRMFS